MLDGEATPGAAEAGHHVVGDQQDAVAAADVGDRRPVLVDRRDAATGRSDDRFRDKGRDRVHASLGNQPLEVGGAGHGAARVAALEGTAQAVARRRLRRVGEPRLEASTSREVAADRQRCQGRSVVRVPDRFSPVSSLHRRASWYVRLLRTTVTQMLGIDFPVLARQLATYFVGQVVGQMNTIKSSRDVVREMVEEFVDVMERMNRLLESE